MSEKNEWKPIPASLYDLILTGDLEALLWQLKGVRESEEVRMELYNARKAILDAEEYSDWTPPASAQPEPITVSLDPDPRGVSVGVWQGSHCIYNGAHAVPASAQDDAKDEQPQKNGCGSVSFELSDGSTVSCDWSANEWELSIPAKRHDRDIAFKELLQEIGRLRVASAAPAAGDAQTAAARDVMAERQRQITAEDWAPELDDKYTYGELASAAASYAQCAGLQGEGTTNENAFKTPYVENWPWSENWWKPSPDPRRNLVKAGALILADIERLDRAAIAAQQGKGDA